MKVWKFEKFIHDEKIYAICPVCEHYHAAGYYRMLYGNDYQYKFCPECGTYLFIDTKKAEVVLNKRSKDDFLEELASNKTSFSADDRLYMSILENMAELMNTTVEELLGNYSPETYFKAMKECK